MPLRSVLAFAFGLLLLAAGCAGRAAQPLPPGPAGLAGVLPALAGLGTPRTSSVLSNYDFVAADMLASDSAQLNGTTLELQAAAVSWAVLGANFPALTATKVSLSGACDNVYVLASDYASGRWKVVGGPVNAPGSFNLPAGAMRADDSCFIALLCPGGHASSIGVRLELSDSGPVAGQPVSGKVLTAAAFPLANVSLALSGAGSFQATSGAGGTFSFPAVPPGNYTLTATLADHAFAPASRPVVVAAAPVAGQDFTASLDIQGILPYAFRLNVPAPSVFHVAKGINIDVYVEPGAGVPGWQAAYDTAFESAMLNWNALSDPWGLFHLRSTTVEADAEIKVTWINSFNNGGKVGESNVAFFNNGTINLPYTVQMATHFDAGAGQVPVDADIVRKATVHEVGHCLGLWEHSDQSTDIMFPSVSTFEVPSRRDLLTLYTLFNTTPDYTTGGRGPSAAHKLERRTISRD